MSTLTLFKSRSPEMGYVFRSGRTIHFVAGQFATANQKEIDELNEVCAERHPCFYIDSEQSQIEEEALDPLAAMKAKIREEERLKLLASMNRDMGETTFNGKLGGIANSSTIRGLAVESGTQQTGPAVAAESKNSIPAGSIKVSKL